MCEFHLLPRRLNLQRLWRQRDPRPVTGLLSRPARGRLAFLLWAALLGRRHRHHLRRSSEPLALPTAALASHGLSQGGPLASPCPARRPRRQPQARGSPGWEEAPQVWTAAGSGEPAGPAALAEAWSWASRRDPAPSPGHTRPAQQGLSSARLPLRKGVGLRLSDLST